MILEVLRFNKWVTNRSILRYNRCGGELVRDNDRYLLSSLSGQLRKVFAGGIVVQIRGWKRSSKITRQSGQDLVEFAIVLPLLLLILFGVADLGRLFHATVAITNAAREGARFGSLYRNNIPIGTYPCNEPIETLPEVIFASCAEGRNSGIDISRITVTATCPQGCSAFEPLLVTVTYNFDFILGNVVPGIGSMPGPNMTLQRTAEMLLQ